LAAAARKRLQANRAVPGSEYDPQDPHRSRELPVRPEALLLRCRTVASGMRNSQAHHRINQFPQTLGGAIQPTKTTTSDSVSRPSPVRASARSARRNTEVSQPFRTALVRSGTHQPDRLIAQMFAYSQNEGGLTQSFSSQQCADPVRDTVDVGTDGTQNYRNAQSLAGGERGVAVRVHVIAQNQVRLEPLQV